MNRPQISFVTINYNGAKDTAELIHSIQTVVHSVSYEIIVVDNASQAHEAQVLQTDFPDISVIASDRNVGFSGGNNLGIEVARGEYIFIINNDTFLEEDHLQSLIRRLESNPSIGAVSPKIRFAFPPRQIQFAGYTPLSDITLRNKLMGFGQDDDGSFDHPHSSPYLHGAAMLVKREVMEKVGKMPELYFLYYEELDWCTQMTRAGYKLWYEPACTVFHKESQSTGQQSALRSFYLTRNRLLYAWRNRRGATRLTAILYQLCVATPKAILSSLSKGRFDLCRAIGKGVVSFIVLPHKMQGL